MSNSKSTKAETEADNDDFDIDKFLRLESNSFLQEKEIARLLDMNEFSKNPMDILEIDPLLWTNPPDMKKEKQFINWIDERLVRQQFKKKSLLVHPDKCQLPNAPEAFQILKKAQQQAANPKVLEELYHYVKDARYLLTTKKNAELHPLKVVHEVRRLIKDVESRSMLLIKNTEGREELHKMELAQMKKTELKEAQDWAKTREDRVGTWRNFHSNGPKVKKRKVKNDGLL